MSGAYYNENDPFAAQWLRELIKAGLIADGEVDERDIRDVRAEDVSGFTQCHWFAGIGGWSYALRLAGWPDDRPVWTGSCPCQPFSSAGRGQGESDARHLWPVWRGLIQQRTPGVVFGEQAAGKGGTSWLDAVLFDLEDDAYATAATVVCAAGVGAPHARPRLYFVGEHGRPDADRRERSRGRQRLGMGRDWIETHREEIPQSQGSVWTDQPRPPVLADGVSERVAKVRGFGNSVVPQVAQAFIEAYCEATMIGSGTVSQSLHSENTRRSAAQEQELSHRPSLSSARPDRG